MSVLLVIFHEQWKERGKVHATSHTPDTAVLYRFLVKGHGFLFWHSLDDLGRPLALE